MNLLNTKDNYGSVSIILHWLMFLLLIAVFACIELRELFPKGSDIRNAFKMWHFMLGLTVFLLVLFRVNMRLLQQNPVIKPQPNKWTLMGAKMMHIALYIFMIGMPIGGWLILSGEGKEIPFFGLTLPALIAENKDTAEFIQYIHGTVGEIAYYLIGFHALAALFHHYILKDNTLKRMIPSNIEKK